MFKKYLLDTYRFLFARPIFEKLNLVLLKLALRGLGVLNYENTRVSGEANFLKFVLPKLIQNDSPVFFDVGANVGNYSESLSFVYPVAAIYAFEPHKVSYQELERRFKTSPVMCLNFALGDCTGELDLYDRKDQIGSSHASLHQDVILDIHDQQAVSSKVLVRTIDEFSASKGISYIDFLKIDTEGHELSVLIGASEMLKTSKIGCIQFEFNEMNIITKAFIRDFQTMLSDFQLYRLLPTGLIKIDGASITNELFGYQNIVCIKIGLDF